MPEPETPPKAKTRIAPTPSGYLHIGNAFSFVLTALVAHWEKADILLRIDDLDQARYRSRYADDIFRSLDFLQIEWQEGPQSTSDLENHWSQHKRLDLYHEHLQQLEQRNLLFACRCSRREVEKHSRDGGNPGHCRDKSIALNQSETALRIITDQRSLEFQEWPGGSSLTEHLPPSLRDFVVRRKDGIPANQLASVVDDLYFGVNTLVRGEDLYSSTLAQVFLARVLEATAFSSARFLHHPLIRGQDGEKLSKSTGSEALALKSTASARDIYRQFSRWLGLKQEAENLEQLKEMLSLRDFQNLVEEKRL